MFRTRQQYRQTLQDRPQLRDRPLLQLDLRRHHVVRRQVLHPERVLVDQQVPLTRLKRTQGRPHRRDRLPDLHRRPPPPFAVVDHHRQHRRQLPARRQLAAADQLQVHPRRVRQYPGRHVTVHRRLELQQHQKIEPPRRRLPETHPPHGVGAAAAQVVVRVLGRKLLQGGEIKSLRRCRGEPAKQVLHHPLVVEPALERRVVELAHRPIIHPAPPGAPREERRLTGRRRPADAGRGAAAAPAPPCPPRNRRSGAGRGSPLRGRRTCASSAG